MSKSVQASRVGAPLQLFYHPRCPSPRTGHSTAQRMKNSDVTVDGYNDQRQYADCLRVDPRGAAYVHATT